MFRFKTIVFLLVIASMALAACQPTAPVATKVPTATEVSIATEVSVVADLACSPNCQYSDMVIGFLQTGSEGGWRAAEYRFL